MAGTPIEVVAGLVFREGRLLIAQRPAGGHLGGLWEFPGGKRHSAESPEGCLNRELKEELGIEVEVGELVDSVVYPYPEKTVCLRFYRCRLLRGEPRPLECQSLKWITAGELGDFDFPPADQMVLDRLLNSPELWR